MHTVLLAFYCDMVDVYVCCFWVKCDVMAVLGSLWVCLRCYFFFFRMECLFRLWGVLETMAAYSPPPFFFVGLVNYQGGCHLFATLLSLPHLRGTATPTLGSINVKNEKEKPSRFFASHSLFFYTLLFHIIRYLTPRQNPAVIEQFSQCLIPSPALYLYLFNPFQGITCQGMTTCSPLFDPIYALSKGMVQHITIRH